MIDTYEQLEARVLDLIGRGDFSEDEFNECALAIFRFQQTHNQPYENFCRRLTAPLEISSWREIPAVPQSAFKQFPLRSFPKEQTTKTFRTSGTTGEGFGEHHFRSLRLCEAAILRGWDALALPRLPQIVLTPSAANAPHSSLSHMMKTLQARAGEQQFCIDADGRLEVAKIVALLRAASSPANAVPISLGGTALAFLHLFEALEKSGESFALLPGSFAVETGGYKGSQRNLGKAELHGRFARFLGLTPDSIINEYGMTELSSQFYTRGVGHSHRGEPWIRALVIDPETSREAAFGAVGVLRIFDLANLGSVLAIQTQDLALRREEGFELLGRDPAALPRGCSRAADEMLARPA